MYIYIYMYICAYMYVYVYRKIDRCIYNIYR